MAGYVGIGTMCFDLTLRELDDMYWGRLYREWDHTAATTATLINVNRTKDAKVASIEDMHPFMQSKKSTRSAPLTVVNLCHAFGVKMPD